ncbi:MAG: gamma-glutamyltransferase, partial [Acidobacteria bacterium]
MDDKGDLMRRRLAAVLVILMTANPGAPSERPAGRSFATRSVVYARHGMVAAAHPLAVQIGVDVLKKGGSAADAAIAVNAALGFLEPMSCGIGGDLFAMVWDAKTQKLYGLNASGRAPRALTADKVKPDADGTIRDRTPDSWTVPGAADGWFALHEKFGRLPMADLLAPTIRAAREGEAVPEIIAALWEAGARKYKDAPGFAHTYLPGGRAPREGEVFKNPDLARAYEAIATGGRDAYYRGPIAKDLVAFSKRSGGYFSEEDLAADKPDWVEPISTDYRG